MGANNIYGNVRMALVDPARDVEIRYHYRPTRSTSDERFKDFKTIEDVTSVLKNATVSDSAVPDNRLPGMYTLSLPASIFGEPGFYTLVITPKEFLCRIADVGTLSAYPDVRGIVVDLNSVEDRELFDNDNLSGYVVNYFDYSSTDGGLRRQDYTRIITSSNRCEPVSQNNTTANTSSKAYRYNVSGSLAFLTLTPSVSPSFKSNATPFIGKPNGLVSIGNTKFDPVTLEIHITEHDIETVSYMLEGEQTENLENGRITTYNFDGEVYKQQELMTVKDNYTKRNMVRAKINRDDEIIEDGISLEEIKQI